MPAPAPALRRAPVGGSVRARPARARLAPVGVGGTGRCPGRRGAGSSGRFTLSAAPEAAAGFCERALSLLDETAPERAGLLALRCRAQARASRPAAAAVSGREALALLPPGKERYRTAVAVLGSLLSLGRIDDGIVVADEQVEAVDVPAALRAQRALLLVFAQPDRRGAAGGRRGRLDAAAIAGRGGGRLRPTRDAYLNAVRHAETVRYADLALDRAGSSVTLQLQALGVAAFTEALAGLIAGASRRVRHAEKLTRQKAARTHSTRSSRWRAS